MKTCIALTLSAVLLLATGLAWAQERPDFRHGPPRSGQGPMMNRPPHDQDTHELVETIMMVRLSKLLDLNDEETVVLVRQFGDYREKRMEHRKKSMEMLDDLRASIEGGVNDRVIENKLKAHMAFEKSHHDLKRDFVAKVGNGFSAKKRAKLYVFLSEFDREMRGLIRQARERQRMEGFGPDGRPGSRGPGDGQSFRHRPPGSRGGPGGFGGPPPDGQRPPGPPPPGGVEFLYDKVMPKEWPHLNFVIEPILKSPKEKSL